MVPAALRRSTRTKTIQDILQSIPIKFTLNTGHVKFFYNKLGFLQTRFNKLADEMERRGYNPDRSRIKAFDGFDSVWLGDWTATKDDNDLVMDRINLRISQKPHLYKD
jgi:deoxyribonuclease (pyrimidine dimer)